ncbi:MAG: AI-2E family transporter, partial [Gemmatimonadota bacterium]|nr:AI-2E family transporter [Gemmatimonadota bacterium]
AVPDLEKSAEGLESARGRSVGITILAVLAMLYTLYFARDFLMPITFALLMSFLLSPVVRALARIGIPSPGGAAIVLLGLLGVIGAAGYGLSGPVEALASSAPATLATATTKLRSVLKPILRASATAAQVEKATTLGGPTTAKPAEVVVQPTSLVGRVFGTTQRLLSGLLEVLLLLYFLLASGDLFLQKLIKVLPRLRDKRTAVQIARATEASISTYLLTTTMVNVGEGLGVAGAMYLWHMPNPLLWGALAAALEFIPYVGATVMVVVLGIASLTTIPSVGVALLVPASFLAINVVQNNLVSPYLLGHRLSLNPVALFVGLAFWFTIWGIPGAFIAVPLLATFKIFCDHIQSLASLGEFLGGRDASERRVTVR